MLKKSQSDFWGSKNRVPGIGTAQVYRIMLLFFE